MSLGVPVRYEKETGREGGRGREGEGEKERKKEREKERERERERDHVHHTTRSTVLAKW